MMEIDASGLQCPMPILRAKKALNTLAAGDLLKVIATDPGSVRDFAAFAKQTGHTLLESAQQEGKFIFLLRKTI